MSATQIERERVDCESEPSQVSRFRPGESQEEALWWPQVAELVCPLCRRRVFSCNSTSARLKTRILIFEQTCALAKCRYCRNDIVVPIELNDSLDHERLTVWDEELHGVMG